MELDIFRRPHSTNMPRLRRLPSPLRAADYFGLIYFDLVGFTLIYPDSARPARTPSGRKAGRQGLKCPIEPFNPAFRPGVSPSPNPHSRGYVKDQPLGAFTNTPGPPCGHPQVTPTLTRMVCAVKIKGYLVNEGRLPRETCGSAPGFRLFRHSSLAIGDWRLAIHNSDFWLKGKVSVSACVPPWLKNRLSSSF
jgi:hypothetical protein